MDISHLQGGTVNHGPRVDATVRREQQRRRRVARVLLAAGMPLAWVAWRQFTGRTIRPGLPAVFQDQPALLPVLVLAAVLALAVLLPIALAGRSPHAVLRPADATVRLRDVVGAPHTTREAIETLNVFLNHQTFQHHMGGTARRGVLFEGQPGTGKTHLAKALAAESGVPFLFVSASEFHSMFPGQTARRVRSYFRALRAAARREGGAIGFIDEFDAIGTARTAATLGDSRSITGGTVTAGVVNELLVQMQGFEQPTFRQQFLGSLVDRVNRLLPAHRRLRGPAARPANVLLVAATNRVADLDPALLRPGRFDRTIHFDLPPRAHRIEIVEYYLTRKRHDRTVSGAFVADLTPGYTPVRIERLLDEALVLALRSNRSAMNFHDVIAAQMVTEVGLSHDVGYHPDERRRVAVHEAGHALLAALIGRDVKLASILRRSGSLGLVAHGEVEERFLHTPSEAADLMVVALAGRAAEIQEFGEASSGIANDLAVATNIAAQQVGVLGAGGSLLSLDVAQVAGADNLVAKVLGDPQARAAADQLLHAAADRAACALLEHRCALLRLADGLYEYDELTGDEVHAIVASAVPG